MIPERNPYNNWSGNGSTTTFDFDFYIENATQLAVYHTDVDGVQTTLRYGIDYSIHEFQNENGSYITFPIAGSSYSTLADGEVISLCLTLPISQENEYGQSSYLNLTTLEYSLDYLTRLIQIVNRQVERAAKVPEGSDIDADDLTLNIIAVGESIDNIDTVAGDLTNIDAVAANKTNIDTVAGSIANIDAVGADIVNVGSVAADLENIDTVAGDLTNIDIVSNSIENINNIGNSIINVNAVANDLNSIDAVKNNAANINTVAGSIENVNNVGTSITKVNAVADDLENIDEVIDNLDIINSAPTYAQSAAISASAAAASAESVNCGGQIWVTILEADWELNPLTGKYEYEVDTSKTPAITGIYKGNWYNKKLVEVDIKSNNGITYLISSDAFDGLILGSLTLLNGDVEDSVATEQATIALSAANNAASSAILASDWAIKTDGTVDSTNYSAKHYAIEAAASAISTETAAVNASNSAVLAQNWAIKTDGKVDGSEYSAKYYAELARQAASQVNADWSETDTTSKAYILNKPTIPTVPTTLSSFTDDLGTSPSHSHSQYLTSHQDISGKEDILKTINILSANGTISLSDNSLNSITPSGNITFTLPAITDNTVFHQILVQINLSTVYTIDIGTTYFFDKTTPDMSNAGIYNLIYEYDKANQYWVAGVLSKGASI